MELKLCFVFSEVRCFSKGPLRLLFSFLGPKDSFIPDPEIIKMGKRAPYLSGFYLLDRGDGFGSGMEDRPRAHSLLFLSLR